jgi:RNA polymerase sigma factor (sigma-70 family)
VGGLDLSGGGGSLRLGGDADLLAGVMRGEAATFGRLYVRHARIVFAFCGRRSGDWGRAEDLASVVFLEAWQCRDQAFLVQGSLRPWLLRVAITVIPASRRAMRRHRAALGRFVGLRGAVGLGAAGLEAEDDGLGVVGRGVEDDGLVQRDRGARRAGAAMKRLSRPYRQVIELCLLGELTVAEAGEVLGVPLATARTRLGDGRARLRRLLRARSRSWLGLGGRVGLDPQDAEPTWLTGPQEGERRIGGAHLDRSRARAQ